MTKQTYYFKNEYYGEDWIRATSFAMDEEAFAEEQAEEYWADDPTNPDDFDFEIEVKRGEDGESKKFKVTAEASVDFYAREINNE